MKLIKAVRKVKKSDANYTGVVAFKNFGNIGVRIVGYDDGSRKATFSIPEQNSIDEGDELTALKRMKMAEQMAKDLKAAIAYSKSIKY